MHIFTYIILCVFTEDCYFRFQVFIILNIACEIGLYMGCKSHVSHVHNVDLPFAYTVGIISIRTLSLGYSKREICCSTCVQGPLVMPRWTSFRVRRVWRCGPTRYPRVWLCRSCSAKCATGSGSAMWTSSWCCV